MGGECTWQERLGPSRVVGDGDPKQEAGGGREVAAGLETSRKKDTEEIPFEPHPAPPSLPPRPQNSSHLLIELLHTHTHTIPGPPWLPTPLAQHPRLFRPVPCTGSAHCSPLFILASSHFLLSPENALSHCLCLYSQLPSSPSVSHSLPPLLRGTLMLSAFPHILSVSCVSHCSDPSVSVPGSLEPDQ